MITKDEIKMKLKEYYANPFSQSRQEGGDHYLRLPIQPWEIIDRCGLNYYEGNILKYLLRRKEDRVLDLKKARHYLDHLIEREEFLKDKH